MNRRDTLAYAVLALVMLAVCWIVCRFYVGVGL
jgi:hypothetical protein